MTKSVVTDVLEIAYEESGPVDGEPVVLMHGFPYDAHAYDEVAAQLAAKGYRAIVPYLRGYGPTQFLRDDTMRSGQQAAIGKDLLDLLDALSISRATLVGYDWGGRAACIVAALYPERVRLLVTIDGYNIQNIAEANEPQAPENEYRAWYQHYFQTERGRLGLERNRHEFCRLLWKLWSPTWDFSDDTYAQTATSFDNPDFVDIVIHSYRHRRANAPGDPRYDEIERQLAAQPKITVPSVVLEGADDGVGPPSGDRHDDRFALPYTYRLVEGAGHNSPQEKPGELVAAIVAELD